MTPDHLVYMNLFKFNINKSFVAYCIKVEAGMVDFHLLYVY